MVKIFFTFLQCYPRAPIPIFFERKKQIFNIGVETPNFISCGIEGKTEVFRVKAKCSESSSIAANQKLEPKSPYFLDSVPCV